MKIINRKTLAVVCNSKTGRSMSAADRSIFMSNHHYGARWGTSEILSDLRAFKASGCSLDY